jgi:5-methylcytosine-specific restriction protein B
MGASAVAWLVRGANVGGVNVVPDWISQGYVSVGWQELGEIDEAVADQPQLLDLVRSTYPDDPPGSWPTVVGNLRRFLREMLPGHLVITVDRDKVYIGRVAGLASFDPTAPAASARRRPVDWLNATEPASRKALEAAHPTLYSKLRTLLTVTNLKEDVAIVSALAGLSEIEPQPRDARLPEISDEVATDLMLPRAWLQEAVADALAEKRQVVFYGPPGTGKTYVAQKLAEHFTQDGGAWELIQFHPSYSYEDFFEGYRPAQTDTGSGVAFQLTYGPLRRMAKLAADDPGNPYILIVDEINRGNVPKIFGELLFLLEYRDRAIPIQYSPEPPFALPRNLFLIGTMNTADRSIALVDAALRRRFYFVPFMPTGKEIGGLLRAWLANHGLDDEPARLLEELNRRMARDEMAIGPSYMMTRDGTAPNLERVWRHAIMPLLEEHYYGSTHDVNDEFGLEKLRAAVANAVPDAETGVDTAPDEPAVEPAEPAEQ